MLAIVDYGVGNLFSLKSSLDAIGVESVITGDAKVIENAERVILPGVGAFEDAVAKLRSSGLFDLIVRLSKEGKPIMGICLGMQLLFDKSYEYGEHTGLGLIQGNVSPIKASINEDLKIPHMGWNALNLIDKKDKLFKYIKEGDYVYFVHSYYATDCSENVIATSEYGTSITACVKKGNTYGCQFHPEKSGKVGLNILKAFCEIGG